MQIQFTEQQASELRRLARARETSVAAVVRAAVQRELGQRETMEEKWARARSAIGAGRGDGSSVAEHHDEYLADAYADD